MTFTEHSAVYLNTAHQLFIPYWKVQLLYRMPYIQDYWNLNHFLNFIYNRLIFPEHLTDDLLLGNRVRIFSWNVFKSTSFKFQLPSNTKSNYKQNKIWNMVSYTFEGVSNISCNYVINRHVGFLTLRYLKFELTRSYKLELENFNLRLRMSYVLKYSKQIINIISLNGIWG